MKKDLFILCILLVGLVIGVFDFSETYNHYKFSQQANPIKTKGIVTGYSTGGRNHRYYVKWFDTLQKEHYTTNLNISPLPEIGDSVAIIYFQNNMNKGIIDTDKELLGGLKEKGLKLTIIIIVNIGFLIYFFKKKAKII